MAGNKTLTIIKPCAVQACHAGKIISMIQEHGFRISAMKLVLLTKLKASEFYSEHIGRPFYEPLIDFMTSGPVIVAILEKEDAVSEYRKFIGPTDPAAAPEGSIRHLFGKSVRENAVHGSDSDISAERESNFFFSSLERF